MISNGLDNILVKRKETDGYNAVNKEELELSSGYLRKDYKTKFATGPVYKEQGIDIAEEYSLLGRLYEACPEHTVEPYALILDETEKPVGYVMEKVKGIELSDYLSCSKSRNKETDKYIAEQIKSAVSKYHERGTCHGDLHERNIMLCQDYTVKIIDPFPSTSITMDNGDMMKILGLLSYSHK
ncbi:MAG: protein kinase [Candidatus Parvarchaeota archaeon]|nr:protein kinase [Candidatus Parvarchaeota archaeon]